MPALSMIHAQSPSSTHQLTLGVATDSGKIGLGDQAAVALHQRMADEAQHRTGAERLLVEPRVGIGSRDMRLVRPLLAPKVDFGIARLAVGAEHRGGLRRSCRVLVDRPGRNGAT